jgi:hypothetical protein
MHQRYRLRDAPEAAAAFQFGGEILKVGIAPDGRGAFVIPPVWRLKIIESLRWLKRSRRASR